MAGTTGNVVFALSPATVNSGIIYFSTKEGTYLYITTIASLDTTYSVDGEEVKTFINELQHRVTSAGWDKIFTTVVGSDPVDLRRLYVAISFKYLKTHCDAYINTQSHDDHTSTHMYQCVISSVRET